MQQILQKASRAWDAMAPRRKVTAVVGILVALIVFGALVRSASMPTMALLYSGLDSSVASGVIDGLERQGVIYEIRDDAIYVPASIRDEARISLAGEGLPAAGEAGYELLDNLSGFGTTSEMFDAAFWRAREGELARTILASSRVVRARVHIGESSRRPFEREMPMSASVTVTTSSGVLGRQQAEAIRYLVASAVAGLETRNVAVIDQEHGVILRAGQEDAESALGESIEQEIELRRSVQRLLEARVGPDAAVVEVSVETIRDSETIHERVLDPTGQVVIHTDTEDSTQSRQGGAGAVTVASNLADGDVDGGAGDSTAQSNKTRERVNYEVSEVVRERVRPPGDIRRITVAVMIDGVRKRLEDGTLQWTPRPQDELEALRVLVESAVGYDEARGDIVTLRSLEFTEPAIRGSVAENNLMTILSANAMSIIQILTLGLVSLMLGLFVVRPLLKFEPAPVLNLEEPQALEAPMSDETMITQSGVAIEMQSPEVDEIEALRALVEEEPEKTTRLLKNWLEAPDEGAQTV